MSRKLTQRITQGFKIEANAMAEGVNMRNLGSAQDGIALPNLDARELRPRVDLSSPPRDRYSYFRILQFDFKLWTWNYFQRFC